MKRNNKKAPKKGFDLTFFIMISLSSNLRQIIQITDEPILGDIFR